MSRNGERTRGQVILAALVVAALALPPGMAGAQRETGFSPGSAGLGDSYFPRYGNGGYRVEHYALDIRYNPATNRLVGRARIKAVARKNLSRFNLDFVGLRLSSITVDGVDARWRRWGGHELVVTPRKGLRRGHDFKVVARYAGVPQVFSVPGTSIRAGVQPTDDGALIWGEPEVAAAWFPANDHPRDKATFTVRLTVPKGLEAISNGRFMGRSTSGGWSTWTWSKAGKMASYLATAAIGEFDIRRRTTATGIPVLDAVDSKVGGVASTELAKQGRIVRFLARRFGAYPFRALGAIVERHDMGGAALETQTRPVYDSRIFAARFAAYTVVHELAHMWYGDSVSVRDWRHIWLNEGFATYAEWLWNKSKGRASPLKIYEFFCTLPNDHPLWEVAPGDPGRRRLFDGAVYVRGAMTLQAVRRAVGHKAFFAILRGWATQKRGGTGTTAQFKRLAERISGDRLGWLFNRWLFRAGKPAACKRSHGGSGRRLPAAQLPRAARHLTPSWTGRPAH